MLYSLFAAIALKSLVLVAVAWLAAVMLRRRSAAARHALWTAVFAALLALPWLSLLLPALRMPVPVPDLIVQSAVPASSVESPAATALPASVTSGGTPHPR